MVSKFLKSAKNYLFGNYEKFILAVLLICTALLFNKMEFPKVDAFIRDGLQYLNDPNEVDKSIVTVNIDADFATKPYNFEAFKKIVTVLEESNPKNIIFVLDTTDFTDEPSELMLIGDLLKSKKNIFYTNKSPKGDFKKLPGFSDLKNYVDFDHSKDSEIGSDDKKIRRTVLDYTDKSAQSFDSIAKLNLKAYEKEYFKFSYNFWGTKQVFFKTQNYNTFGHYKLSALAKETNILKDNTAIVGAFDKYSYIASKSIFDIFSRQNNNDIEVSFYPRHATIANIINMFVTGKYIKYFQINDLLIFTLLILALIFSQLKNQFRILFFLTLPFLILIAAIIIYLCFDFYFDFTRSLTLIICLQATAIPIIIFLMLRNYEQKKLEELNIARIDTLIEISEQIAHDIRSPLSSINLVLSKLEIKNPEYLEIIKSSINRIDSTAASILKKYKQNSFENSSIESIDVDTQIRNMIKEKKFINPHIKYIENLNFNISIMTNSLIIDLILSNILDNSAQALANTNEPQINISTLKKANLLTVTITDNGPGVPDNLITLIGYKRLTTKKNKVNSGIALLNAKRMLEQINGTFSIENNDFAGTTVQISLNI